MHGVIFDFGKLEGPSTLWGEDCWLDSTQKIVSSQLKVISFRSVYIILIASQFSLLERNHNTISFKFHSQSSFFSITFSLPHFHPFSARMIALRPSPVFASPLPRIRVGQRRSTISCEVALQPESKPSSVSFKNGVAISPDPAKIGSRVRVKAPVRVYHVPRVPELELSGMEGEVKQNLLFWRGKSLTANRPFKVEFVREVEGRGLVKFVAHLEEDELEFV
ncbi:hypothetical protein BT93_J0602 [Corymbia citriodora subsp. variegata]|nr:hypothetical protein BT93_J0602 [Corymbia citriodora subsp. variegata]